MLDELGNDLGVGVRLELVPLVLQKHLHVLVVGQNPIVHNDEIVIVAGTVGMRIHLKSESLIFTIYS